MKNDPIVLEVKEAKKIFTDAQPELLRMCRDVNVDINERWEIWTELVDKEHHDVVYHFQTVHHGGSSKWPVPPGLLALEEQCSDDGRHARYEWDEIYERAIEDFNLGGPLDWSTYDKPEWKDSLAEYNKRYAEDLLTDPRVQEVKEWFIQENFGGFTYDW